MSLGIDYAAGRPSPDAIVRAGYRVVCRYLSHSDWKAIDADERKGLLKAGLDIVLVFEDGADNACKGAGQGKADGAFAAQQAKKVGAPDNMVIYFAVDCDTQQFQAIGEYLDAAAQAAKPYRVGVYGSYDVCQHALQNKHAVKAWQTAAWSSGRILPQAAIYQHAGSVTVDGVECDVDEVRHKHHGGWLNVTATAGGGKKHHKGHKAAGLPVLKSGSSGQPVRHLQVLLNSHRDTVPALGALPPLVEDGNFAGKTEQAVNAFKQQVGLKYPGVVGTAMWRELIRR